MKALTSDQLAELAALAAVNLVLGRKSFIHRSHWRSSYAALVRRGLVSWTSPPKGFSARRFAGTRITRKGLSLLRQEDRRNAKAAS